MIEAKTGPHDGSEQCCGGKEKNIIIVRSKLKKLQWQHINFNVQANPICASTSRSASFNRGQKARLQLLFETKNSQIASKDIVFNPNNTGNSSK